eukprot:scaffold3564_cov19-Tisochrysis_lutea.AAC.1
MDNTDQFLPCTQAHACTRVSTRGTHTHTHTHTVAFAAAQGAMSAQISSAIGVAALAGLLRLQTLDVAYTAIQDAGLASLEVREDTHPLGTKVLALAFRASKDAGLSSLERFQATEVFEGSKCPRSLRDGTKARFTRPGCHHVASLSAVLIPLPSTLAAHSDLACSCAIIPSSPKRILLCSHHLSLPYNAAAQSTFALQATRIPYPFIHNLSSMLSLMSGRSRGNYPEAEVNTTLFTDVLSFHLQPLKGLVHLNLDSCRFSSEGCKVCMSDSDGCVVFRMEQMN